MGVDERIAGFKQQLIEFWSGLSRAKKIALVSITTLVLLGVVAVSVIGTRVRYAPLYHDLNTEDSAAIATRLKELKIPHRVTRGGIQVPEDQVHELRLELASSGLPRGGGVGFEIFDSSRLGATEFEQQVNLRRALEGELARSIATIDGVVAARVHLVMPERRLFAARSEGASASVVVKLESGYDFGRREVAGVVHLVSAAVPGLSKDRVSLVSTEGVTLHRPDADQSASGLGMDETRSHAARALAASMETHVRTLLERITGPGGVDVRIVVDLEESTRERTEEHYEPTQTALRSEHKSEEATTQEGATVAGVPGAQTNLPDVDETVASTADDLGGNLIRRSRTRNWEVDRVTEKISTPSGEVARVSAAVLIDGTYVDEDGVQTYKPRDAEELARLEAIVKNAIGFDDKRGDAVRVEGARFLRPDAGPPTLSALDRYQRYLPYALAALGMLTLLAMFVLFLRAVRAGAREAKELEAARAAAELEAGEGAEATDAIEGENEPEALGEGEEDAEALPADLGPEQLEEQRIAALQLATQDPASAAIVVGKWLTPDGPEEPPIAEVP